MNYLNNLSRGLFYKPINQYRAMRGGTLELVKGKVNYEPDEYPLTTEDLKDIVSSNPKYGKLKILNNIRDKMENQTLEKYYEGVQDFPDYVRDINVIDNSIQKLKKEEEKKIQKKDIKLEKEFLKIDKTKSLSLLEKIENIKKSKNDIQYKSHLLINNTVNDLNMAKGKGFEEVIIPVLNHIMKNEKFINNDKNNKLSSVKNIWIDGKYYSEQDLYIYDSSGKTQDIELKNYNIPAKYYNGFKKENIIKSSKDSDIPLQIAKFGNSYYQPYFAYDKNGEFKLYNVWDIEKKQWINNDFFKDLFVLYNLSDGLYNLKINNEDNFDFDIDIFKDGIQLFTPPLKQFFIINEKREFHIDNKKLKPFSI